MINNLCPSHKYPFGYCLTIVGELLLIIQDNKQVTEFLEQNSDVPCNQYEINYDLYDPTPVMVQDLRTWYEE